MKFHIFVKAKKKIDNESLEDIEKPVMPILPARVFKDFNLIGRKRSVKQALSAS